MSNMFFIDFIVAYYGFPARCRCHSVGKSSLEEKLIASSSQFNQLKRANYNGENSL
jgi:hypothetical protein